MDEPLILDQLRAALPPPELSTDPDVMASYSRDHATVCEAGQPVAVVLARSVETVVRTLRLASAARTPVVTRGAGTGLSGGANALDGGIVLSLAKMDAITSLDVDARLATVEPGVLNGTLDAAARVHGLRYAPDPASRDISTIGGNVATNAGGACCLKYGVTGDHVAALTAVLADGTTVRTGSRTVKNVAGLDLNRLLIGSEGTLAVIVGITVRLLPVRPIAGTMVAFFDDLLAAGRAIVDLQAAGSLSTLEVMDRTTVRAVEAMTHMDLDTDAAAMLIAQAEVAPGADAGTAKAVMETAEQTCAGHGASFVASTTDESEGRMFMAARTAALPALEQQGAWLLDDVAVGVRQIPELLARCAEIAEARGVTIASFGHAGDGNLHPTIVYDPGDRGQRAAAVQAFDDVLRAALAMGGTLTGEHGIGQLKQSYVEGMVGSREVSLMRGIKAAFDPLGILNPGRGF